MAPSERWSSSTESNERDSTQSRCKVRHSRRVRETRRGRHSRRLPATLCQVSLSLCECHPRQPPVACARGPDRELVGHALDCGGVIQASERREPTVEGSGSDEGLHGHYGGLGGGALALAGGHGERREGEEGQGRRRGTGLRMDDIQTWSCAGVRWSAALDLDEEGCTSIYGSQTREGDPVEPGDGILGRPLCYGHFRVHRSCFLYNYDGLPCPLSSSPAPATIGFYLQMEGALMPMDPEQLREYGHKMVDFIADYYKSIESYPVLSQVKPGYLKGLLPDSAPNNPESLQDVFDDIIQKIIPGITHWQSPDYFAYYPSNSSTAGFLGEMLSAGFNIVGFSWFTSPAATELEVIVLDWLAKILKLPDKFLSTGKGGGVIQGTASEAILVALLAARDMILRKVGNKSLEKLVVYASDQTHSALQKACQIAGIYPENFRILKVDSTSNYALSPEVVSKAISNDIFAGLIPCFICATVGTTSSAAVDPIYEIGKIAKAFNMWFHVDAAYAGSACVCPEYRHHIDGVEEADSFNMNAHKWFLTNFDCSVLWVQDRNALVQSLSTNPEFLKNKASQDNSVVDFKDWQIPLGRRFRSLKLWLVLRLYGVENLQSYIRNHIRLAEQFEQLINSDSRFEIVAPRTFSLVCFRLIPTSNYSDNGYKLNRGLLDAVNASGKIFISHTVLSGKFVLRFAVGAPLTEDRHIVTAWKGTFIRLGLDFVLENHTRHFSCQEGQSREEWRNVQWIPHLVVLRSFAAIKLEMLFSPHGAKKIPKEDFRNADIGSMLFGVGNKDNSLKLLLP
ncbi:tyrosine decarboxylase 1 [Canna indica]|uniref:Tyrosine decarboxylase 1 n=1 Tax=Canna indica TaxID=4628 RepID=A0AAQ3QJQ2_9LILI|nr:tyrosine decarboxylase 1 [Canna indica]